jgi:hypothetical protein
LPFFIQINHISFGYFDHKMAILRAGTGLCTTAAACLWRAAITAQVIIGLDAALTHQEIEHALQRARLDVQLAAERVQVNRTFRGLNRLQNLIQHTIIQILLA